MRDAGYAAETRIAVDDDYVAVAQKFDRLLNATKLEDAPPVKKGQKPQIQVPAYTEDQLKAWLGLGPDEQPSRIVSAKIDDRSWESVDLWDDEPTAGDGEGT